MSTTITEHVGRPRTASATSKLSVAGATCYVLWGCLHLMAAYAVTAWALRSRREWRKRAFFRIPGTCCSSA